MRSISDVKGRLLERVEGMARRPSMYAHDGRAMDLAAQEAFSDLTFLDDREATFDAAVRARRERYGKLGTVGRSRPALGRSRHT